MISVEWKLMMLCLFRTLYPFISQSIRFTIPFTLFNFDLAFYCVEFSALALSQFNFLFGLYTFNFFSSLPRVTSNWIDTENPPVSCIIHPNHIKMLPYHFTIVYSSIIHLLHPVTLIKLLICFYLLLIRGGFENFYTRVHHTKMRV